MRKARLSEFQTNLLAASSGSPCGVLAPESGTEYSSLEDDMAGDGISGTVSKEEAIEAVSAGGELAAELVAGSSAGSDAVDEEKRRPKNPLIKNSTRGP